MHPISDDRLGWTEVPADAADDPRLLAAVQDYLAQLEAGRRPDRREWARRFPDLIAAMTPYLDALDLVHGTSPLVPSPLPDLSPPPEELLPAAPLGDFRLVREIGRGGMGVVYEAIQLSLGRRVALKVLPFAAALDGRQLQRFKTEAQAAAQLHHTNIVPVYGVGCERGVHYYAMQLIEGQNLAEMIRGLRGQQPTEVPADAKPLPGPPPSDLRSRARPTRQTVAERAGEFSTRRTGGGSRFGNAARLVARVAEALDHAHQCGVIHRDVKPENLLIDDRGTVWVTDFGLAQFHADARLTRTGDLVGTLRYMSPEQAGGQRGPIDHRTDVYSLGATLYELLTLQPIFDGLDRQTLLCQILTEEPRPPRAIDRTIPVELETIVLKAVSKFPAERYATAQEMADDLQRFLEHKPIQAKRAGLVQRTRKWMRRHPSFVAAAVALLVLTAVGSLVSAAMIGAAYERERLQAKEARDNAARAEERFRLARQSVDLIIQVCNEELADKPHMDGPRRRLLEAALVYYQEFIDQRSDDTVAQAELGVTRDRVKKILADLALMQGAGTLFLLNDQKVLEDLEADGEQRAKLGDLNRRLNDQRIEQFRDFQRLTAEQRRDAFLEMARETADAVQDILTDAQRKRLDQIALQMQGPMAFRDSKVASVLELTADQKERLRALEGEASMAMWEMMRHGGPGSPGGPPKGPPRGPNDQGPRNSMEKALALLTKEQTERWKEMTGEPYKGPIMRFFGPPGIPGPPGRGRGGDRPGPPAPGA